MGQGWSLERRRVCAHANTDVEPGTGCTRLNRGAGRKPGASKHTRKRLSPASQEQRPAEDEAAEADYTWSTPTLSCLWGAKYTLEQRRQLKLKATFESGLLYCCIVASIADTNPARATRGQYGVNLG